MTLTITTEDHVDRLAVCDWTAEGGLVVVEVGEDLAPFFSRVIADGLNEWVGRAADATHRTTLTTDPAFVERLTAYLWHSFRIRVTAELHAHEGT